MHSRVPARPSQPGAIAMDLLLCLAVSGLVLVVAIYLDVFQILVAWLQRSPLKQLDEVVIGLLSLPVLLTGFALRRWQELRREAAERRRAEAALRFVLEASQILASSLNYETTLSNVAQLVVPTLADLTTVYLLNDDGTLRLMAIAGSDAQQIDLLRETRRRHPLERHSQHPVVHVVRDGQPVFWPEVSARMLETIAPEPDHLSSYRTLQVASSIVVPLVARGRTLGAMSWAMTESGRRYSPADLELAEELARRAALAVDNARLYLEAQDEIAERKALEAQLTYQAFHDPLTGLANRALLRDRLAHALARASRHAEAVGLLILDLDDFKVVNDSLGHEVGDHLLTAVAERLRGAVRDGDTVARLGGDEFIVLLEGLADVGEAISIARRVTASLQAPVAAGGRELVVTTSIGIALNDLAREQDQDLLRHADVALYQAKQLGKARYVVFEPGMQVSASKRLALKHDLRAALEQGELELAYQPIVDLTTGQVREVEAFVRWRHPERGMLYPGDFIALAEETGLIVPLGHWVLEEAAGQMHAWHRQYPSEPPLTVSVNLSPRQFRQPALVDEITHILDRTGLDPRGLKLEVTESVIMEDLDATAVTLRRLKALGIALAIDDFGTGYSSLATLKRSPIDTLKVDRSFIREIGTNREDRALVQAVVAVAQALDLSVTVEGIETNEQAGYLRALGCHRGQGHLFARPGPAAAIGALLDEAARAPDGRPSLAGTFAQ